MQDLIAYHWKFGKTVSKCEDFIKPSRKLRVMFSSIHLHHHYSCLRVGFKGLRHKFLFSIPHFYLVSPTGSYFILRYVIPFPI